MEKYAVFVPKLVSEEESLSPGHRACLGCGQAVAMRQAGKALGHDVILINAAGCMSVFGAVSPHTSWSVPWLHTLFENTGAVVSGVDAALKVLAEKGRREDKPVTVVGLAGDGGTMDIGLQALSGALERGHDFLYLCFDNEAYMNTGIQRSSATPYGARTTTSPVNKKGDGQFSWKKNMPLIVADHNIPYVATACPSYPFDLMEKVKKGAKMAGPAYIHIFSVCPTGWGSPPDLTIRLGRLAVETGTFPLYEVEQGRYKLNVDTTPLRPIQDYLSLQSRFNHLSEETVRLIQERVNEEYAKLKEKSDTPRTSQPDTSQPSPMCGSLSRV
jgi:pyruvate ferredoxin oxidoreductase beta subunit